jgi:hypothetical protein
MGQVFQKERVVSMTDDLPSVDEIYGELMKNQGLPLPGFEKMVETSTREKASRIYDRFMEEADRTDKHCNNCWDNFAKKQFTRGVYDTPWDDIETEKYFCSESCEIAYLYEGDFSYFTCEHCEREICGQNRKNGWHIQYRDYDDSTVCLRCYEALILENGIEREKLEKGEIPGMFFSYGNLEPKKAGFEEVPDFQNFLVASMNDSDVFIKKALELMDEGRKVVVSYERMAIGGLEGYVTMMVK